MDEKTKYRHTQTFLDDDYLTIKLAVKGKDKKQNNELRQVPSAMFLVLASMAFIAFATNENNSMILYIVGAFLCVVGVFFVNYIDQNGILLYKILFAKSIMKEIIFYIDFMECHNEHEVSIIYYHQIRHVYENEMMLFLRLKGKERNYLFLIKRDMDQDLYAYLKSRFIDSWTNVQQNEHFHL